MIVEITRCISDKETLTKWVTRLESGKLKKTPAANLTFGKMERVICDWCYLAVLFEEIGKKTDPGQNFRT